MTISSFVPRMDSSPERKSEQPLDRVFELLIVERLTVEDISTSLTLCPPSRVRDEVLLSAVPDWDAAIEEIPGLRRPLAAHIDNVADDTFACSVLCSTGHGAERLKITLPVALALCQQGIHTVFTRYRSPASSPEQR